jgi:hypothetical protein
MRNYPFNNNTDYSGLANANPAQLKSFSEGMLNKQVRDLEKLHSRGFGGYSDNERRVMAQKIKDKNKSFSNIARLRFKAKQSNSLFDDSMLAREVSNYNNLAKQTYNPSYGRGMGLMDPSGGYNGVSFNKF